MIIKIIAVMCVIRGVVNAISAMNDVRRHPRPTSTVDKNIFLYMMGQ
jgi:hypothetical protein